MYDNDTKGTPMSHTEHSLKASRGTTGLFAMLRGLLGVPGTGAPSVSQGTGASSAAMRRHVNATGLLTALVPSIVAVFALSTAPAQAEPPRLISEGNFGTHEAAAVGVAVEGSGDLFVSSLFPQGDPSAPSTVVKLDPSGKLLSPPSPFGSAHFSGVAVNPANGDVYVLGQEEFFAARVEDLRLRPQHGRIAVVV